MSMSVTPTLNFNHRGSDVVATTCTNTYLPYLYYTYCSYQCTFMYLFLDYLFIYIYFVTKHFNLTSESNYPISEYNFSYLIFFSVFLVSFILISISIFITSLLIFILNKVPTYGILFTVTSGTLYLHSISYSLIS